MAKGNGPPAGEELRLIIERAERIKEEIKEMQADEKDVYAEAKSRGFDVPTIKRVIKWRSMDPDKRREAAALDEVYKAALGLGDGSLSDLARDYLTKKKEPDTIPPVDEEGQHDAFPTERKVNEDFGDDLGDAPVSVEDARKMGADAAHAGKPVMANPFKAGDDRRAAWDEGWCGALGSDGMDLPPELRANPKPKKNDDDDDNEKKD